MFKTVQSSGSGFLTGKPLAVGGADAANPANPAGSSSAPKPGLFRSKSLPEQPRVSSLQSRLMQALDNRNPANFTEVKPKKNFQIRTGPNTVWEPFARTPKTPEERTSEAIFEEAKRLRCAEKFAKVKYSDQTVDTWKLLMERAAEKINEDASVMGGISTKKRERYFDNILPTKILEERVRLAVQEYREGNPEISEDEAEKLILERFKAVDQGRPVKEVAGALLAECEKAIDQLRSALVSQHTKECSDAEEETTNTEIQKTVDDAMAAHFLGKSNQESAKDISYRTFIMEMGNREINALKIELIDKKIMEILLQKATSPMQEQAFTKEFCDKVEEIGFPVLSNHFVKQRKSNTIDAVKDRLDKDLGGKKISSIERAKRTLEMLQQHAADLSLEDRQAVAKLKGHKDVSDEELRKLRRELTDECLIEAQQTIDQRISDNMESMSVQGVATKMAKSRFPTLFQDNVDSIMKIKPELSKGEVEKQLKDGWV